MSSPSAIDKTLMVLDAVLEHSRFTDVVTATGLAKSTVHRIMASLVEHEFVAQSDDGSYHPGPKALRLAGHALTNVDLATVARPVLADLVAQTRCTVHVGLLNGDEAIYVARLDGPKPYRMPSRVGQGLLAALHRHRQGTPGRARRGSTRRPGHPNRTASPYAVDAYDRIVLEGRSGAGQVARLRPGRRGERARHPLRRRRHPRSHGDGDRRRQHLHAVAGAVDRPGSPDGPAAIEAARKISAALGYREPT